jgi:hypothetical protein
MKVQAKQIYRQIVRQGAQKLKACAEVTTKKFGQIGYGQIAFGVCLNMIASVGLAAQAADKTISDKADWLKRNLQAISTSNNAEPAKLNVPEPLKPQTERASSLRAKLPSMRPFVPNRYLPRRADLDCALKPQSARLDNSLPTAQDLSGSEPIYGQTLTGQVSTSFANFNQPSNQATSIFNSPEARQALRKQAQKLIKHIPSQALAKIWNAQTHQAPSQVQIPVPTQNINQGPIVGTNSERTVSQAAGLVMEAPILSPEERKAVDALNEIANQNALEQAQTQAEANLPPLLEPTPGHTAGPAPFPLNLIPPSALADIIGRGKHKKIEAPPAYFGSWHNQSQFARTHQLMPANFHSHLTGHAQKARRAGGNFTHYAQAVTARSHARSVGRYIGRKQHATRFTAEIASHRIAPLLSYPSYESSSRYSLF